MTELELIFEVDGANEIEHSKNTDDLAAIVRGWIAGFFDETNITSVRLIRVGPFSFRMFQVCSSDGLPKFGDQRIYYSTTSGDDVWYNLDLMHDQELECFRQNCSDDLWDAVGKVVVKDEIDKTPIGKRFVEEFGENNNLILLGQNFDEVI